MNKRALVVDDEKSLLEVISYALEEAGLEVAVATSAREAEATFERFDPDVMILDLMLPDDSGYEVCRRVRDQSDIPIIILSARTEEVDKVLGLELGADDYVTKPFSPRELVSRVRAHVRRSERLAERPRTAIKIGGLTIDETGRQVFLNGETVHLTNSEYQILVTLGRSPGKAFSRSSILNSLWSGGFVGDERTVDVHIHNLRGKIEIDPQKPQYIVTVRGFGYRLSAPE